ncbi:hypothetical protein OV450_7505 [Actinobacteria bacterium OV450]|nr:hypothetical protein OV450_7505 [Actinobacteria bacterium OV450]
MSKFARLAAVTAITALLTGGALAPSASADNAYTCNNQGVGVGHTVSCLGVITVNNVLDNTTVTVHDVNVLNGTQLNNLQVALVNVSNNNINVPVNIQLVNLQNTVVSTYLTQFGITVPVTAVNVCAGSICI